MFCGCDSGNSAAGQRRGSGRFCGTASTPPADLPRLRRYLEKEYLNKFIPFLRDKAEENGRIPETLTVSLGFLRLNNFFVTAFPGETFSSTAKELKDAFPELTLCSVTEHGRTVMYLPPTEEFRLGGYESVCMTTAAGSEEILRKESIAALRSFLADSFS